MPDNVPPTPGTGGVPAAAPEPAPGAGAPSVLPRGNGNGATAGPEPTASALVPGALAPGARALSEPLAALAAAFQANAEALRRSQEVQADLHRALERADRSEMVIQTTGALNETFRGLTTVQKSLAQRVEASERESLTGRMFLPVLVIVAVALMGGVLWVVLQYVDSWRAQTVGTSDVATRLSEQFDKGIAQGRKDEEAAASARIAAADERSAAIEKSLAAAQSERDAKALALSAAVGELQSLRGELASSRTDALKVRALEDEVDRLRRAAATGGPDVERLKEELAAAKSEGESLRSKLANAYVARGAGSDAAADPATPSAAADADPAAGKDRRAADRARARVNDLLTLGRAGRPDYLQVLSVGAVGKDRLLDVNVGRYNPAGRLVNAIRAKELTIAVDSVRRVVEFQFADGTVDRGDAKTPFSGGRYSTVVADGDDVAAWSATGYGFVTTK